MKGAILDATCLCCIKQVCLKDKFRLLGEVKGNSKGEYCGMRGKSNIRDILDDRELLVGLFSVLNGVPKYFTG